MASRYGRKTEPPKVIETISQFAGALVGTAVVAGRRIGKTVTQTEKVHPVRPGSKDLDTLAGKTAAVKKTAKRRKAGKKRTQAAGKRKAPNKKPAAAPKRKRKRKAAVSKVS